MSSLQNKPALLVWPWAGNGEFGGPAGFIDQLFRGYQSSVVELTPPVEFRRTRGQCLRRAFLGYLYGRSLSRSASLDYSKFLFDRSGCKNAEFLWFMDAALFGLMGEHISPRQKVIFQPHCPELPWLEIHGSDPQSNALRARRELDTRAAMERADFLILPNEHTLEIYEPLIATRHKINYILSGCRDLNSKDRIPLEKSAVHFLYIGRRLPIKGFDLVLEAFQRARAVRKDIFLYVCGAGQPIYQEGVIDIGTSSRVQNWIASCDYVINFNRQSYFDLSVMETLSVGTPLIVAATGGHRWFIDNRTEGIIAIEDCTVDGLANGIAQCSRVRYDDPRRTANRRFYEQWFTPFAYRIRMEETISRVINA